MHIKLTTFLGAIFFIVFSYYIFFNDYECSRDRNMRNRFVSGVVTNAYIDSAQHAFPRIDYIDYAGVFKFFHLNGEYSNAYNLIQAGDTILKEKGSLDFKIYKGDKTILTTLDFKCKK